jgi:hypothetical protein
VNRPTDLEDLLRQKTWDKEVVLWLGSESRLKDLLSNHNVHELDILDLFDPNNLPSDDDETRTHLTQALRSRLENLNATARNSIVLVVRSCALLARYGVGLKEFYNWFCGDFGMVIMPLNHPKGDLALPENVLFEKDRLFNYFSEPGMCSRIVVDKG